MNDCCKHHSAIEVKLERYEKHCDESDEKGGYRDRLIAVETLVKEYKAGMYKASLIGGVIGALIGTQSSEIIALVVKKLFGL